MTDEADYWAALPDEMRTKLSEIAWRYLRMRVVPDRETALELLAWQQLENEVLEAHNQWLEKVKTRIERSGLEWTRENLLRYCRLREHE
ncbi:hypothetical protein [Mycobacterium paragordonae]|uniref:hypothetical protein n=1 Tax=Mycobacterium paragordonae TaxID=1389713 RepID=UPI0012E0EEB7|nr:hypothetical protein [Mycobacterium paragordonae]